MEIAVLIMKILLIPIAIFIGFHFEIKDLLIVLGASIFYYILGFMQGKIYK